MVDQGDMGKHNSKSRGVTHLVSRSGIMIAAFLFAGGISAWLFLRPKVHASSNGGDSNRGADTKGGAATVATLVPRTDAPLSEDALALLKVYQKVEDTFASEGLDMNLIASLQPWFHGVDDRGDTPWPRKYDTLEPHPLPPHAVRILVVPVSDSPQLASISASVTRTILGMLPGTAKVFSNSRTHYHCTVFHTSHPADPRPDALSTDGGVPDLSVPAHERRAPTDADLRREREAMQKVVESSDPPVLQLDRVVMANSGTLLITWIDLTDNLHHLRTMLWGTFPGACTKQASIIHTSLLRILHMDEPMESSTKDAVAATCKDLTAKLRGKIFTPTSLWWVYEEEFSTVVGEKQSYYFKKP